MRTLLCILVLSRLLVAHDLWLVSGVAGAEHKICARIGEVFPGTVNAPTADRVTQFQFYSANTAHKLEGRFADKQFCAALPAPDGIGEIVVHPRLNQIDAKRFAQFVQTEGLEPVVGAAPGNEPVRYLYSRYSKALVGRPKLDQIQKPLGHVLEIVPQGDPGSLRAGSELAVLVLFEGKPLTNVQVAAVHDGASGEAGTFPVVTRTDDMGLARLRLPRTGLWYARLIYTIPISDPEFQWHHFFSTVTFRIGRQAPPATSLQFELGPFREASIGNVGRAPRPDGGSYMGNVDLFVTPNMGCAWMVTKDALNRYTIRGIEARTRNRTVRALARGILNPIRSFASMMRRKPPWCRDDRPLRGLAESDRGGDRVFKITPIATESDPAPLVCGRFSAGNYSHA